jgi:hypothetical protein
VLITHVHAADRPEHVAALRPGRWTDSWRQWSTSQGCIAMTSTESAPSHPAMTLPSAAQSGSTRARVHFSAPDEGDSACD